MTLRVDSLKVYIVVLVHCVLYLFMHDPVSKSSSMVANMTVHGTKHSLNEATGHRKYCVRKCACVSVSVSLHIIIVILATWCPRK